MTVLESSCTTRDFQTEEGIPKDKQAPVPFFCISRTCGIIKEEEVETSLSLRHALAFETRSDFGGRADGPIEVRPAGLMHAMMFWEAGGAFTKQTSNKRMRVLHSDE